MHITDPVRLLLRLIAAAAAAAVLYVSVQGAMFLYDLYQLYSWLQNLEI